MDERGGQDDLQEIQDARDRIIAAFETIAAGAETLALRASQAIDPAELARLHEEIDEERMANAQLAERIRILHEREAAQRAPAGRVTELEGSLAEAQEQIADLTARRAAERAEVEAVLAELMPLIEEAR
jgi:small-conductance mechanosensitive channel